MTANDTRLTEISITIEDDSDATNGDAGGGCVRTRSQRGALQYRVKEVSILVKILKLLIYELSNCLESAMAFADDDEEETDAEVSQSFLVFDISFPFDCFRVITEEEPIWRVNWSARMILSTIPEM